MMKKRAAALFFAIAHFIPEVYNIIIQKTRKAVIKAIQAKLDIDDAAEAAGKLLGGLGGLFGKN